MQLYCMCRRYKVVSPIEDNLAYVFLVQMDLQRLMHQ